MTRGAVAPAGHTTLPPWRDAAIWLPLPVLFVATVLVDALDPRVSHPAPLLLTALNVLFLTGAALVAAYLVGRVYVLRGVPGLPWLGAGATIWALGALAAAFAAGAGPSAVTTIHNACALASAACHVVAGALVHRRAPARAPHLELAFFAAGSVVVVALVTLLALAGALPAFFVQGRGGTPLRQAVLGSAIAGFALAAVLLGLGDAAAGARFRRSYAAALALVAVGLFGVMGQSTFDSVQSWLGRGTQYLGGLYMAVAAVGLLRDAQAWGLPLQAALRETEARSRAIFESTLDAIVLVDPGGAGRVVDANPAACALFGYTLEEFRERTRDDMVVPGPALDALVAERAARGHARGELTYRRKDGSTFTGELSATMFADSAGRPRAVAIIRDVTLRRRAEEALRESDRRKTEFLALLSHELRNPLAPIRQSAWILQRSPPATPAAARAVDVIRRQADHLTRLVDDLLDATRIERGKVQLRRERLDLRLLIETTVEDVRGVIEARGLRLRLALTDGPLPVDADRTRIAQVVGNLLHNAAKFTDAGGTVEVRLARAGDAVELCVKDDGAGIGPEALARLFQPFEQADRTLASAAGGLGLGLALSRGLVELHGGRIAARSEGWGRGAEFVITLPLAAEPADTPVPA